jgi:hypothetical protein
MIAFIEGDALVRCDVRQPAEPIYCQTFGVGGADERIGIESLNECDGSRQSDESRLLQ